MLETKDLYKDYIIAIESKKLAVTIKLGQYQGSQEYFKNCIINNKEEFEQLNINVDTLFANPFIAYAKIKQLVENGQLNRVAHYVKSYVLAIKYYTLHKHLLDRLNKSIMPYEVYRQMIINLNGEISKHLLEGGYYNFGAAGRMYILEKPRTFFFMGRKVSLPVDWGFSKKVKKQLIEDGKTPYDSRTAPDGIKWHYYHDTDFGYWYWWEAGAIKNRAFMRFVPSNFKNRKGQYKFESIDEILNTTKIGNVNKMVALLRFDPLYYLKFRRLEWIEKHAKAIREFSFTTVNH
jgi:hypothetical protein